MYCGHSSVQWNKPFYLTMKAIGLLLAAALSEQAPREHGSLRPLESLPFFRGERHSQLRRWAEHWRRELLARPRFRWSNPPAGTIKVFARPPSWLKPDFGVNRSCEVACDYASSLDSAHVALSNMRPVAPQNGRVVNALMSFEPQHSANDVFSSAHFLIWIGTNSVSLANVLASRFPGVRTPYMSSFHDHQ